ncbi:MAG TPA: TetR/AcrR family transcriptional regulator [Sandaracinaceae bacterium LLY-WYZ-13_1]|nr:TetR/AcrR family transcriptional regulator [Sandaracinaceae bacterium LLY-WYZ-13_1]
MARQKEFDPDEALTSAMEIFWERGFENTTMSALVRELGIGRQSLYDTFGGRQQLYEAALRRYRTDAMAKAREMEGRSGPLLPLLREYLDEVVEEAVTGSCAKGCFLVNAAVERGGDPGVRALVVEHFERLEGLLARRIAAAQRSGEVREDVEPRALAKTLLGVINGMRVAARMQPRREDLRAMADAALRLLS